MAGFSAEFKFEGPLFDSEQLTLTISKHYHNNMEYILSRSLVPRIRAYIPVDTGRLARSFMYSRRGNQHYLYFKRDGYYWHIVESGKLPPYLDNLYRREIPRLAVWAYKLAIQQALGGLR